MLQAYGFFMRLFFLIFVLLLEASVKLFLHWVAHAHTWHVLHALHRVVELYLLVPAVVMHDAWLSMQTNWMFIFSSSQKLWILLTIGFSKFLLLILSSKATISTPEVQTARVMLVLHLFSEHCVFIFGHKLVKYHLIVIVKSSSFLRLHGLVLTRSSYLRPWSSWLNNWLGIDSWHDHWPLLRWHLAFFQFWQWYRVVNMSLDISKTFSLELRELFLSIPLFLLFFRFPDYVTKAFVFVHVHFDEFDIFSTFFTFPCLWPTNLIMIIDLFMWYILFAKLAILRQLLAFTWVIVKTTFHVREPTMITFNNLMLLLVVRVLISFSDAHLASWALVILSQAPHFVHSVFRCFDFIATDWAKLCLGVHKFG